MAVQTRDGVNLAFSDTGSGEPPLVLIHPWAANRSFLDPQVDHFSRSHRVIAVDLRGFGESDKPKQDYTITTFADDVAWLCHELAVDQPVVIGHSMGGVVALDLAARHPDLVRAIVALDSPILPSPDLAAAAGPLLEGMRSPAFREVTRQFQGSFVGFANDEARRDEILDVLASGEQHVMAPSLESVFSYDSAAAAATCSMPVLYVGSGGGFSDIERFKELCPQLQTAETHGSGHFHQLEVPDELNTIVEKFLASLPG